MREVLYSWPYFFWLLPRLPRRPTACTSQFSLETILELKLWAEAPTLVLLPPRWTPAFFTTFFTTFFGAAFSTTFLTTFFGAAFFTTFLAAGLALPPPPNIIGDTPSVRTATAPTLEGSTKAWHEATSATQTRRYSIIV